MRNKEEELKEEIEEIQNEMRAESPINPFNNISKLNNQFFLKQAELKGIKEGKAEALKEEIGFLEDLRCDVNSSSITQENIDRRLRELKSKLQSWEKPR